MKERQGGVAREGAKRDKRHAIIWQGSGEWDEERVTGKHHSRRLKSWGAFKRMMAGVDVLSHSAGIRELSLAHMAPSGRTQSKDPHLVLPASGKHSGVLRALQSSTPSSTPLTISIPQLTREEVRSINEVNTTSSPPSPSTRLPRLRRATVAQTTHLRQTPIRSRPIL